MTEELDPGLALVVQHLEGHGGPPLGDYKERCLRRRLAVRMRACGVESLVEYAHLLGQSATETDKLLQTLTINVTQFFRNPEVWDRLEALLRPVVRARQGAVRIWSAGCASGEEPYSLALLCCQLGIEELGSKASPPVIDATDIDVASLERARVGRYPKQAVSAASRLSQQLVPVGDEVQVPESVRRAVRVRPHDMLREPAPDPPYDLVLCRNVIIYFGRDAQDRLMEQLTDALHPGGFLMLGRVETVLGPARARLELLHPRDRIYRRVS
ncbi:MAG TPA: protein-glutamate O-methyltransferase CheR [Gemmatimonadales bacterium]|nr:protein-glutamate O-methyltransferase CheR [Gemmatimonadales bacterium]